MMLLNGLLIGGVAAAMAPIAVHIWHRRKYQRVDWGAMRFLVEVAIKSRRSLMVEQWLLLLVRMLMLAVLGLALTRPALLPPVDDDVDITRIGATASVLLIDDSPSLASGRGSPRLDQVKALALAYLDTLAPGDEVSLIRMSQIEQPVADPIYDLEAARAQIQTLEPAAIAGDMPALMELGLSQVARHVNPNVELVLLSDGARSGWQLDARERWSRLRNRLRRGDDAQPGSRAWPRLLVLSPGARQSEPRNAAVTAIELDRSLVPVSATTAIRAKVRVTGAFEEDTVAVRLLVHGQQVDERPLPAGGAVREVVFEHSFSEAGSNAVTIELVGARDDLTSDDRRHRAVEVVQGLPVLVVEGRSGEGLRGSGAFARFALDPIGDGSDLFAVETISAHEFDEHDLAAYRVVILADVPALPSASVAALERFVVAGGGLLVGLGEESDLTHIDRFWARGGDGFLPCPLGPVQTDPEPVVPAEVVLDHPALAAFVGAGGAVWGGHGVTTRVGLDLEAVDEADLGILLRLATGEPLLVERRRGLGRVALLTSSLDPTWGDLVVADGYAPLVRGTVAYLGARLLPPRDLEPGERVVHVARHGTLTAVGPDGEALSLEPGTWQGRAAAASQPLTTSGLYTVHDGDETTIYAVALAPGESDLTPLPDDIRDQALADLASLSYSNPDTVRRALTGVSGDPIEFWRWLVVAAVVLLFAETLLTRSQHRREQRGATQTAQRGGPDGG